METSPIVIGASLSEPHTNERFRRVNHVKEWIKTSVDCNAIQVQQNHGRITVQITNLLNMVRRVNHDTDNAQRRLLILQIWFVG